MGIMYTFWTTSLAVGSTGDFTNVKVPTKSWREMTLIPASTAYILNH